MAFVTNYTLSKLARSLDIKEKMTEQFFVEHIFNDRRLYQFFNRWELKYLFNYKKLLENKDLEYYNDVPISKDTGSYVFQQDTHLKYHLFEDCEYLNKDFMGYTIPPEVKTNNLINEYRDWFKINNFKNKYEEGNIDLAVIVLKYNREFAKKYSLSMLNEKYNLVINKPNGGHSAILNDFDKVKFENTIEQCVQYKRNLLNDKQKRILGKWEGIIHKTDDEILNIVNDLVGENFVKSYGLNNIKDLWINYAKVKRGVLLKNLIEYFKWTFANNSKIYDRATLEDFNMVCCSGCENLLENRNYVETKKKNIADDLPF